MRRMRARHAGVVLALNLAATALLASPGADAEGRTGKPDLVVTGGGLLLLHRSPYFVTRSGARGFSWAAVTENIGKRTARKSRTQVEFVVGNGDTFTPPGAGLPVPALAPGDSHQSHGTFKVDFDEAWDFGTYPTRICADGRDLVTESREANNCAAQLRGLQDLYVVPGSLKGTVTGQYTGPLGPGVIISWQGTVTLDMFTTDRLAKDGVFRYLWSEGPLTYTVSGTDTISGCAWSGTGQLGPSDGERVMKLAFRRVHSLYSGHALPDPSFSFPVTATCPDGPHPATFSPAEEPWLNTGSLPVPFPTRGLTNLHGDVNFGDAGKWHWDLDALS